MCFLGEYFFELDQKSVLPGYPKLIKDVWSISGPIDAAFTRINCQGKTYIFKVRTRAVVLYSLCHLIVHQTTAVTNVRSKFTRETSTGGLTTVCWTIIILETSAWALIRFPMTWMQRSPSLQQVTTEKRKYTFSKVQIFYIMSQKYFLT